jgi:ATP-dependent protease ClpP protease subunit
MTSRPNYEKALRSMARVVRPTVKAIGRRVGNTFSLDLSGPLLPFGAAVQGIDADAVIAGLAQNQSAAFVRVEIDSIGGNLLAGWRIYSALRSHPGYKTTIADRHCASAATLVFLAGDFRTCMPRTEFLIHEPERPLSNERWTASKHAGAARHLRQATDRLVTAYSERTGRSGEVFEREIHNEKVLSVSGARKCGLVHCLAGEERWINGRPYYFPDRTPASLMAPVMALSVRELETVVRKNPGLWRGTPLEHVAYSTKRTQRGG